MIEITNSTILILAAMGAGALGSGGALFASYFGLAKMGMSFPKKFFTDSKYIMLYMVIGALLAGVLQTTVENWAPIQALAVGAAWPTVLSAAVTKQVAQMTKDETKDTEQKKLQFIQDLTIT